MESKRVRNGPRKTNSPAHTSVTSCFHAKQLVWSATGDTADNGMHGALKQVPVK